MTEWVAVTGLRRLEPEASGTLIPSSVLDDSTLSLEARGLYALLLSDQGKPVDPYVDAIEEADVIAAAIEELVAAGYAAKVTR